MKTLNPSKNQFSLRRLFLLMTVSACAFAALGSIVQIPILRFMLFFYLPLFVVYFLIRGPFLYRRWRRLQRDYVNIAAQRQAIVDQARNPEAKEPEPDAPLA